MNCLVQNKKIKNATPEEYEGINFKSKLEVMVYKTLLQAGFNPKYEPYTYTIWEGFKPTVPFYTKIKCFNKLNLTKLRDITYTPDIYLEYEGIKVIIEVKGAYNDVFPYKFKMFRKYIESLEDSKDYLIFEIFTKRQLLGAIEIIKQYAVDRKNEKSCNFSSD